MGRRRRSRSNNRSRTPVFLLGLAIGLALMAAAVFLPVQPVTESLIGQDQKRAEGESRRNSTTPYYLRVEDAEYLNRIFKERSHEVAYCGLVTETDQLWLRPWLADTESASETTVTYTSANCPTGPNNVLMHTHPSGAARLSERDKQQLKVAQKEVMCIQVGQLSTEPKTYVNNLVCYELVKLNGKIQPANVPVMIDRRDTDNVV